MSGTALTFTLEERVCWLCLATFAIQVDPPYEDRQPCPRCGVGDEKSWKSMAEAVGRR